MFSLMQSSKENVELNANCTLAKHKSTNFRISQTGQKFVLNTWLKQLGPTSGGIFGSHL
jgi:hypothetical protein